MAGRAFSFWSISNDYHFRHLWRYHSPHRSLRLFRAEIQMIELVAIFFCAWCLIYYGVPLLLGLYLVKVNRKEIQMSIIAYIAFVTGMCLIACLLR